ncbi:MAG: DNA repair protein RecN [Coriobacteriia bacterium]|nr:DNA repair protein RecN [Coriobacteriia bacterium]
MLEELHIRDVALIEEARLEFGPGLTVLTGETGAGKTVLISSLQLLMGQRADLGTIRNGADSLRVEGRFMFDNELLVSRSLSSAGRNTCKIDGEMATVANLSSALGPHIDLHGQHDHQALLRSATHLSILDAFAEERTAVLLDEYREAQKAHGAAVATYDELKSALENDERELEMSRLVSAELERVDPQPREDELLERQVPSLQHAQEIEEAASLAWQDLTGEDGAADSLARAASALERVLEYQPAFREYYDQISALSIDVSELAGTLRSFVGSLDRDSSHLDSLLLRLSEIESLEKRFGPTLDVVLEKKRNLEEKLSTLERSDEVIEEALEQKNTCERRYRKAATELSSARHEAAARFVHALQESIAGLALEHARFEIEFKDLEFEQWTPVSSEHVEILYSPVSDGAFRPLAKIASGGEMSRVMLGLKSVIGKKDRAQILVFDEIDAGIGGVTAFAVGQRLRELSKTHQVIVVTHLAQVAVMADAHYVVRKTEQDSKSTTAVVAVKGTQRVREVARLLSGEDTDIACAHAVELLESVGR